MINDRNTTQVNTPTSNNVQYGYPAGPFDLMNFQPMPSPTDLYSFYPTNVYQPFGSFDEHKQWTSTDLSGTIPTNSAPLSYHPQMYTPPAAFDITRTSFDYPPTAHGYSPYHPGYTPSTYPIPSPTGGSTFDLPWNAHHLSGQQSTMQITPVQAAMTPIGTGLGSNKRISVYDQYPSTNNNNNNSLSDMLAQQINLMELNPHSINEQKYSKSDARAFENTSYAGVLPSKEQSSSGPKSYAFVVSSDSINRSVAPSNRFLSDSYYSSSGNNSANNNNSHTSTTNYPNSNPTVNRSERATHKNDQRRPTTPSARTKSGATRSNVNGGLAESLQRNHQYNPKDFNLNPKGARFFVIKSYSEDDIHRSIKYNIWCSTEHGNKRLDAAFREREGKGPIYLFFSVNASGHFCGMAEMMSPLDYDHQTDVWHMSNKWQGKFEVKWIYVKDVPNQQFRHIRLENNENKPVTNSRDTQEVPYEKGKLMLKTLHLYQDKTSIFDDFHYYESKEVEEEKKSEPVNNDWFWNESNEKKAH